MLRHYHVVHHHGHMTDHVHLGKLGTLDRSPVVGQPSRYLNKHNFTMLSSSNNAAINHVVWYLCYTAIVDMISTRNMIVVVISTRNMIVVVISGSRVNELMFTVYSRHGIIQLKLNALVISTKIICDE